MYIFLTYNFFAFESEIFGMIYENLDWVIPKQKKPRVIFDTAVFFLHFATPVIKIENIHPQIPNKRLVVHVHRLFQNQKLEISISISQ